MDRARDRNDRIERSMRRLQDIVTPGLAAHLMAVAVHAAGPAPVYVPRPLVTLLPQIEELEDGDTHSPAVPALKSATDAEPATLRKPRALFPNPRLLYKPRWPGSIESSSAEAGRPSSSISQMAGQTPEQTPTLRLPPAEVVPAPTSDSTPSLITPEMVGITETFPPCDQADCVESFRGIVPKTNRPASPLRFPGLSRMFSN